MNSTKTPASIIAFFLFVSVSLSVGCASKSTREEPAPSPVAQKPAEVQPVVAKVELTPEPARPTETVQTKPRPTPPSQQRTVYFGYDSDKLNNDSLEIIASHVDFLIKNPDFKLTLEGHTDERGSTDYNEKLGSLRAKAIKAELISKGVNEKQINLISYGEEKPAVMGNNDDAWQSNRRAIFVYNQISDSSNISQSEPETSGKMLAAEQ